MGSSGRSVIAVARETREGETRVALVPELVRALAARATVAVEPGAGLAAGFPDEAYVAAGAEVRSGAASEADLLLAVRAPEPAVLASLRPGAAVVSFLPADGADAWRARLDAAGLTGYALDLVPRISRAQPMDALTSQSLVAGYRAAVVAADLLRGFLPLTITAAGTLPAARVLVLGAGVAGLQAIATARSLGARVQAYDVRASSAEEIASLGAEPVDLGLEPLDGAAGYAREMDPDRAAVQQLRLAPHVAAADVVITTAAVPGRRAPVLVTRAMVEAMRPGAVVVDIAAESGGNVEGVVAGRVVRCGGAQVWGGGCVPAQMPGPASRLYAGNLAAFTNLLLDGPADDEILRATRVTGG